LQDNTPSEAENTTDSIIKFRHSLTTQTLLQMGTRITLVVMAVSILSYLHIVQTLEVQTHDKLTNYIQERGAKDSAIFVLAQDNHKVFKQQFLQIVENAPDVSDADFNALFIRKDDGTTRLRQVYYDGFNRDNGMISHHNSTYVGKDAPVDEQGFRNRLVYAYRLLDRFGPAWTTRFANLYAVFPENGVSVYWPGYA
jgi:hypothetical protein